MRPVVEGPRKKPTAVFAMCVTRYTPTSRDFLNSKPSKKKKNVSGSEVLKRDESSVLCRPPLIRKAVGTIVAQNKMVEDGDADQVAGLTEA